MKRTYSFNIMSKGDDKHLCIIIRPNLQLINCVLCSVKDLLRRISLSLAWKLN